MYQWLLSQLTTQCLTFKYTQDICRSIEKINHIWTHGYRISKEQTRFFKLTLRIEGSGRGHWIGRSLSRGSIGCSTGLNSTAAWIPWAPAAAAVVAVPGTAPVTAGFGGNTSLSSYILHKSKIDLTLNLIEKKKRIIKRQRETESVSLQWHFEFVDGQLSPQRILRKYPPCCLLCHWSLITLKTPLTLSLLYLYLYRKSLLHIILIVQ